MRLYVVYNIKGNCSPDDIILEITDEDMDHHRDTRPGYIGRHGRAQWKWTGRNIGIVKERIVASHPSLGCRYLSESQVIAEVVLYSVQQIV